MALLLFLLIYCSRYSHLLSTANMYVALHCVAVLHYTSADIILKTLCSATCAYKYCRLSAHVRCRSGVAPLFLHAINYSLTITERADANRRAVIGYRDEPSYACFVSNRLWLLSGDNDSVNTKSPDMFIHTYSCVVCSDNENKSFSVSLNRRFV